MISDLIEYANTEFLNGGASDLNEDTPLLELGILNSLSIVSLLAFIDQKYGVKIPEDSITPDNFCDIRSLTTLINSLAGGKAVEVEDISEQKRLVKLQESYGIKSELVELDNGRSQHVLRTEGAGPLWVMLPALGNPSTSWSPILRTINGRINTVSLDLSGFGLTDCGTENPAFADHVKMTVDYLKTIENEKWVLIANSAGTMVATEVARQFPDRVKALIITGFGLVEDVDTWWTNLQALSKKPEQFLEAAYYNPPTITPTLERLLEDVLARPAYHNFLDEHGASEMPNTFHDLDVPTLFIAGNNDQIMPKEVVELAATKIPGSKIVSLSRCGHFAPAERPEEFLWVIEDFLNGME